MTAPEEKRKEAEDLPASPVRPILEYSEGVDALYFTPYAWAKLQFMCHSVDTEIGGMALTAADNPFLIEDIGIVKQKASAAFVDFDDEALNDFMTEQFVKHDRQPINCMRIWIHTHPHGCTKPSGQDENTFRDAFGSADWAVMFILAKSGEVYARMRADTAHGVSINKHLDVDIDWSKPFEGSDHDSWLEEIREKVTIRTYSTPAKVTRFPGTRSRGVNALISDKRSSSNSTKSYIDDDYILDNEWYGGGYGYGDGYGGQRRYSRDSTTHGRKVEIRLYPEHVCYDMPNQLYINLLKMPRKNSFFIHSDKKVLEKLGAVMVPYKKHEGKETAKFLCYIKSHGKKYTVDSRALTMMVDHPVPVLKAILEERHEAEQKLLKIADGRNENMYGFTDIFGKRCHVIVPWFCLNRRLIWLSEDEYVTMEEINDGITSLEESLDKEEDDTKELTTVGSEDDKGDEQFLDKEIEDLETGFFLEEKELADGKRKINLSFDHFFSEAWDNVIAYLKAANYFGASEKDIETRLFKYEMEAKADVEREAYEAVNKLVRLKGYDVEALKAVMISDQKEEEE